MLSQTPVAPWYLKLVENGLGFEPGLLSRGTPTTRLEGCSLPKDLSERAHTQAQQRKSLGVQITEPVHNRLQRKDIMYMGQQIILLFTVGNARKDSASYTIKVA